MKCKYCKAETDKQTVFGVLKRTHYDNRVYATDRDTGETTFKAVALVKTPYCKKCKKSHMTSSITTSIIAGVLSFTGIPIIFKLIESNSMASNPSEFLGWLYLILLFVCAGGIYATFTLLFTSFDGICLNKYGGTIDAEDVIAPYKSPPIDVTQLNGSLENRWDIKYKTVSSKRLEKISSEEMKKWLNLSDEHFYSKRKSIAVLKQWYDNARSNGFATCNS